jgi:signal transduction histidine kinase/ligand-binding sensor domain-containing protein/DNA-binding response OmpR family regulator
MRVILFIQLFLCSFRFISCGSTPENFDFSFRRISPAGGFTYGAINTIAEDANGFIWFGTAHGLYRYNSTDVQKFVHNPNDSTTIPGNSIRTIFADSGGKLWIGTSLGVCMYDNTRDLFVTRKFQDKSGGLLGNDVREIFQYDAKNICFLGTNMLGKLNIGTDHFESVAVKETLQENFSCAVSDSTGKVWIGGTNGTVWVYDSSNGKFQQFCHQRSESIQKIFSDDEGLWIGYSWSGLDHIGFHANLISHYGGDPEDYNMIHHNRVRDIYKDESGRLWISTYKGISIIDHGKITNLPQQAISGLPYNSIYKIFRDSKNGIWMGTWSGGLAYRSNYDNQFIHYKKDPSDSDLNDEFVSSFAEKTDGTILIGTEFGNLFKLDRGTNKMSNIAFKTENGKKIDNIKSLFFDKKTETLWIGTFLNGLWYQQKNETLLRPFNKLNNLRISVYALEKSDSGMWIGTYGNGLFHYNTNSGALTQYLSIPNDSTSISSNGIRSIIVAKDQSLWVGTSTGLNQLNPKTGKFKQFFFHPNASSGLSNDEILALHQDRSGKIWIGTSGGGINKYDDNTKTFVTYKSKDGLIGDDVYGIQEDKNGRIWVSTENGISSIDPENTIFRNFYRDDELKENQYNPGAVFLTSSGEILFGNTKGFTLFTPEQMKMNPVAPQIILTSLSVNNKPVSNHSKDTPLTKSLQAEDVLKLSYHENSLTFNFVANNFLLPNKNRFKYRLVNYDNHWIDAGTQNYAAYTKIPAGNYIFEVIGCNNDNLWNKKPVKLKITISPPIWLSGYAYLTYLLMITLILYFIRKEVLERQRYKKELLLERLVHESEAQVHEMKMRFFTNISHEFRTPLTLIASPVNLLLTKFSFEPIVREHLLTMQRNSNRLLRLINQLIDIRRLELGRAVFHPRNTDLIALCREVISCFEMEASDKHIHLSFNTEAEKLILQLDPEKADKIFFNLLSNAMKFTGENGTVTITIYSLDSDKTHEGMIVVGEPVTGNMVCVEFADDGSGIATDELKLIFERFEQGKNHQTSGTGIGLHMAYEYTRMHKGNIRVQSKIGSGSIFTISFPLTQSIDQSNSFSEERDPIMPVKSVSEGKELPAILTEKDKTVTILIIEDNYELKNYLKNLLSPEYRIITAPNGRQGLETALTIIPDLVLTDVMMPQMDGFEVCRQLKNNLHTSHIPVILLTALNESEKQIGGYKTGADAYITKPFDENVLLAQIENLIRSRAKLRELFSVSDTEWSNGMELLFSDRMLIEKATSVVEHHLNDKTFVIDHLAADLGISTSSLYRKLKVLTNQSPTEFVRYIRLKKAIRLMNDGNTNVDEIGYSVGFNSHSYFTNSFKKQFGKTPSDYLSDLKSKKN